MIRKKCHDEVGEYDERYLQLQDYDFWIRLLMRYNIHILPEILTRYRILNNKANVSSERPETINRLAWEKLNILESYLDIKNTEEFKNVFPEHKKLNQSNNEEIVPKFVISYLSLNISPTHKIFAINTLYKLLKNKKTAKKISEKYNFSYKDLIKVAGKYDLFNNQTTHDLLVANEKYRKQSLYLRISDKLKNIGKLF